MLSQRPAGIEACRGREPDVDWLWTIPAPRLWLDALWHRQKNFQEWYGWFKSTCNWITVSLEAPWHSVVDQHRKSRGLSLQPLLGINSSGRRDLPSTFTRCSVACLIVPPSFWPQEPWLFFLCMQVLSCYFSQPWETPCFAGQPLSVLNIYLPPGSLWGTWRAGSVRQEILRELCRCVLS